ALVEARRVRVSQDRQPRGRASATACVGSARPTPPRIWRGSTNNLFKSSAPGVSPGASLWGEEATATFVLVHGAWAGSVVWRQLAPRLRKAGHEVYAPTLTGIGERKHLL